MNSRPRLLFLAYAFPPLGAIGSVRAWNIAKYLTRRGWDVTVVTPDPALWRQLEKPEHATEAIRREGIRMLFTGHRWRCLNHEYLRLSDSGLSALAAGAFRRAARRLAIDNAAGWAPEVRKACSALTSADVDLVLATGDPFVSFELARRIGQRLGRPFAFDYRDLWTNNPHGARSAPRSKAVRREKRLLSGCAAVTAVSPSLADALAASFRPACCPQVITNGYDPEEMAGISAHTFGHFAIVYAGVFYPPLRVITPVMAAMQWLANRDKEGSRLPEWRFHYYGTHDRHVLESARQFGVEHKVVLHGRVPRAEALAAVRGAGVSVVITSVADQDANSAERGIVTGKIFDALGFGCRVLLVSPPGSDAEHVVETSGGGRRFRGSDVAGIGSYLADAISGRLSRPSPCPDYAWPSLIAKFDAALMDAMAGRHRCENNACDKGTEETP